MMQNNQKPIISVVMPVYNNQKFIIPAIESVFKQTLGDFELILIDDGSTDKSQSIANFYCKRDPRIKYFYQQNCGVAAARNSGINRCNSTYILPLDSDDKLAPTYLEKTVSVAEENPSTKVIYSNYRYFGALDQEVILPDHSYRDLLTRNLITATALFRREDYNLTSGYDTNMRQGLEDWEFWLQLLDKDSTVFKIDEALFLYRQREKSRNNSLTHKQKTELSLYIFHKHIEKYRKLRKDPRIRAYCDKVSDIENSNIRIISFLRKAIRKIRRVFF
jgi:glycosyltransferase involved in cell wall biosynthesis